MSRRRSVYWLNSLNIPSCLLVSELAELTDGVAISDVVALLRSVPALPNIRRDGPLTAQDRVHNVTTALVALEAVVGRLPVDFADVPVAAERLVDGDEGLLLTVLDMLQWCFGDGDSADVSSRSIHGAETERRQREAEQSMQSDLGHSSFGLSGRVLPPHDVSTSLAALLAEEGPRRVGDPTAAGVARSGSGPAPMPPMRRIVHKSHTAEQLVQEHLRASRASAAADASSVMRHIVSPEEMAVRAELSVVAEEARRARLAAAPRNPDDGSAASASHMVGTSASTRKPMLTQPARALQKPHRSLASVTHAGDLIHPSGGGGNKSTSSAATARGFSDIIRTGHSTMAAAAASATADESGGHMSEMQRRVVKWLAAHGVRVPRGKAKTGEKKAATAADVAAAFADGVRLCDLVGRLTSGSPLAGIHRTPRATSSRKANVNRALAELRKRPRMSAGYLWATEKIVCGDEDAVWGLLKDIYNDFTKSNVRFRESKYSLALTDPPDTTTTPIRGNGIHPRDFLPVSPLDIVPGGRATRPRSRSRSRGRRTDKLAQRAAINASTASSSASSVLRKGMPDVRGVDEDELAPVADEDVDATRKWLSRLNFPIRLSNEHQNNMDDPVRNGLLLTSLVSLLEGVRIQGISKRPKVLADARKNLELAFAVLRRRNVIPLQYLWITQLIMKGNHAATWGLLNQLRLRYGDVVPAGEAARAPWDESTHTAAELRQLEGALVGWLWSLGVVASDVDRAAGFEELMPHLQSGVMLCDAVSVMNGDKIVGVFRQPRTSQVALRNVSKACEALRQRRNMGQRYTRSETAIHDGDKLAILGLLEDMHISFDGHPPRPTFVDKGTHETPYLGRFAHAVDFDLEEHDAPDAGAEKTSSTPQRGRGTSTPRAASASAQKRRPPRPASAARSGLAVRVHAAPTEMRPFVPSPATFGTSTHVVATQGERFRSAAGGDESMSTRTSFMFPAASFADASAAVDDLPPPPFAAFDDVAPPDTFADDADEADGESVNVSLASSADGRVEVQLRVEPSPKRRTARAPPTFGTSEMDLLLLADELEESGAGHGGHVSFAALPGDEDEEEVEGDRAATAALCRRLDVDGLAKWAASWGFRLGDAFRRGDASEFGDGLLLATMAGKLRGRDVAGVTAKPHARAQRLHNINKALEVFRANKKMPFDYLWNTDEIEQGDLRVVCGLLAHLRKAYGPGKKFRHSGTKRKTMLSNSSAGPRVRGIAFEKQVK